MTTRPDAPLELRARPDCVHCGFCLPACPTFDVLGTEMDGPRGRLMLMDGLARGELAPSRDVVEHLDACLGCLACESACPSGVPYGHELQQARSLLRGSAERPRARRGLERTVLGLVALEPSVREAGWWLLRLVARTGLLRRAQRSRHAPIAAAARLLPDDLPARAPLPRVTPAVGARLLLVGLLLGCVQRHLFADVNAATVRLLAQAGCEVVIPDGQGCCGALHAHAGDRAGARRLMAANFRAFHAAEPLDAIVVNAAGCGSALREAGQLFGEDEALGAQAEAFAGKTRDALQLLDELGLPAPRRPVAATVACHDACHLAHGQRSPGLAERLLARVPGVSLVPLEQADRCCGSGGLSNLLQPDVTDAVLERKLAALAASGADTVSAANAGCLLQLRAGVRRRGARLAVEHPLSLLDRACRP